MKIKQLKQKQEELDNEILKCPKCGGEVCWGWYKEVGCYKDWQKRVKNNANPKKQ